MVTTQQLGCLWLLYLLLKRKSVKILLNYTENLINTGFPIGVLFTPGRSCKILSCLSTDQSVNLHQWTIFCFIASGRWKLQLLSISVIRLLVQNLWSLPQHMLKARRLSFFICLWKQNLVYWRSPQYNGVRLFFTVLAAFLLGSVFWDIGSER
jgi:hypothetical protein